MSHNKESYQWWQTGVIYQIYPRSFKDSNRDGVGDLPGITQKLDYLSQTLGVDAIWLSPIYPSPMYDFGYDVSDYRGIHPLFGTMTDFEKLLKETHRRGMKLILDLVPNHTSSEHPWFLESRSSRDNPKRDWYIWRDPAPGGGVPNNWLSYFGGPAWEWDEKTGQYYLHLFLKEQPDLNYRNPEVEKAMLDNMRFWLDKGVDGFRVDVIGLMMKDPLFRDEPINPNWDGVNPHHSILHTMTENLPEVHEIIHRMRKVLDEYDDRMMVGETYVPNEILVWYYGTPEKPECHLPFNFQFIMTKWDPVLIRKMVDAYDGALPDGAWPNWVLGNHDQHRIATRVGQHQARVAGMLLLTLRGTPTCYYGDELGMENVPIPLAMVKDPPAKNMPEIAHLVGRDPERTPMQWDATPHAGFTDPDGAAPWLPVAENYVEVNVARQLQDKASMLNFYRKMLEMRRKTLALQVGWYRSVEITNPGAASSCFVFERWAEEQRIVVALNFTGVPQSLALPLSGKGKVLLSTHQDREGDIYPACFNLRPDEGCILEWFSE